MAAPWTVSVPIIPPCQEADSGEEACASVNPISGLVMPREEQWGAHVSYQTSLGVAATSLMFIPAVVCWYWFVTGAALV